MELSLTIDQDVVVNARPELLATAIGNLIRNACQYTVQGSVHVRVGGAGITIEDTGPGLPSAVQGLLINHASKASPFDSAGTGIGLALTQRICEHLSATLRVTDRPGGGTVFSMAFPANLTKS